MLLKRPRSEQKNGIDGFAESEIEQRPSNAFSPLCDAIDKMKTDLIKWMFIFAVAEIVVVWGTLLVFFER